MEELWILIRDIMRQAEEGVTSEDIAEKVMELEGVFREAEREAILEKVEDILEATGTIQGLAKIMKPFFEAEAKLLKSRYDALVAAGFTSQEATKLVAGKTLKQIDEEIDDLS